MKGKRRGRVKDGDWRKNVVWGRKREWSNNVYVCILERERKKREKG